MVNRILKNRKIIKKPYTYRMVPHFSKTREPVTITTIMAYSLTEADGLFLKQEGYDPNLTMGIWVVLPEMD